VKFLPQRYAIASFGNGGFRFGEHSHLGHLLILPSGMRAWDGIDFSELVPERADIDFVLMGTGKQMVRPPKTMFAFFAAQNLQFDFMNTSSAVHTYNQVLSDGRRVAAGFLAVE
jgi:uncharacterized protein